jgi:nucleoside-diphosphate-sugar epimerase
MMNTAKILITGATGHAGRYAIEQLLHKAHEVRALVHRIDDSSKRLADRGVGAVSARTGYGEVEQLQRDVLKESFLLQHLREVAADHRAGVFAGTNDLIEPIGGHPPVSLDALNEKHRKAFE